MAENIAIRSGKDRLRYTISFELLLLAILVPIGALVFQRSHLEIGALSLFLAVKAMLLNLLYNWLFDQWDVRNGRIPTERSWWGRTLHAFGFEVTLTITSLPFIMWWLALNLWQALLTDLAVVSIVMFYTFAFTLCYDKLFPIAQPVHNKA